MAGNPETAKRRTLGSHGQAGEEAHARWSPAVDGRGRRYCPPSPLLLFAPPACSNSTESAAATEKRLSPSMRRGFGASAGDIRSRAGRRRAALPPRTGRCRRPIAAGTEGDEGAAGLPAGRHRRCRLRRGAEGGRRRRLPNPYKKMAARGLRFRSCAVGAEARGESWARRAESKLEAREERPPRSPPPGGDRTGRRSRPLPVTARGAAAPSPPPSRPAGHELPAARLHHRPGRGQRPVADAALRLRRPRRRALPGAPERQRRRKGAPRREPAALPGGETGEGRGSGAVLPPRAVGRPRPGKSGLSASLPACLSRGREGGRGSESRKGPLPLPWLLLWDPREHLKDHPVQLPRPPRP